MRLKRKQKQFGLKEKREGYVILSMLPQNTEFYGHCHICNITCEIGFNTQAFVS